MQPQSLCDQGKAASIRRLCNEGGCSYLGRSRLVPERATPTRWSEKSAEVVVVRGEAHFLGEDQRRRTERGGEFEAMSMLQELRLMPKLWAGANTNSLAYAG